MTIVGLAIILAEVDGLTRRLTNRGIRLSILILSFGNLSMVRQASKTVSDFDENGCASL